jgi:hypothetical protein
LAQTAGLRCSGVESTTETSGFSGDQDRTLIAAVNARGYSCSRRPVGDAPHMY